MKSFRKKIQESRLKTHLLVRSWLQPKLGVIGTRYRLAARIRLANRWAAKHPKTTFAGVAGTLLLLLVSTVAIDSGNGKQSERCQFDCQYGTGVSGIPYHPGKQGHSPQCIDGHDGEGTVTAS